MKRKEGFMKKMICCFVVMFFSFSCPGISILPAAIAAEFQGQVMYSKKDLRAVLQSIQTNLTEGLSNSNEIVSLENIRNEMASQLLEAEDAARNITLALPIDFESTFTERAAGFKNLIKEIDSLINNQSADQIAAVLNLVETVDPHIQGEVLSVKPLLPNRTNKGPDAVFKEHTAKPIGAAPTDADLAETEEIIITPKIEALALQLENDVVKIFAWVHNNIDYEPYYGSMKGSSETLIDLAGNDCDQSSLLLALLRASNIPSRYVRGNVELKTNDLMNWTGTHTPEAAVAIFQKNKIPTSAVYKKEEINRIRFDHVWVEAFDGHNWRMLNPSFKVYSYTEGVGFDMDKTGIQNFMDTAVSSNGNTLLVNNAIINDYLQIHSDALEVAIGDLTIDEFFGKREIVAVEKNNTQPYLARGIIDDRKPAEEFSKIPENLKFKIKVILGGVDHVLPISIIADKRLSLVYVPATDRDQQILDYYGGIYNVLFPSLLVHMKPVLQIDGETVATGNSVGLGVTGQYLHIGFLKPGDTEYEFTSKRLTAGNRYNICTTTQKTSLARLNELSNEL